jgi:ArsR family transcriptional regulator
MTSPRKGENTMQTTQVIDALGALAQDTRLKIFRLLVQRGPEGLTVGVIAERLGVPPATLSFHLQQLLHAGLIQQRRESRSLIYSANFDTMDALLFLRRKFQREIIPEILGNENMRQNPMDWHMQLA